MPAAAHPDEAELRVPAPLPEPPRPILAVGKHGPSSVDAEDFARRLGNWGNASRLIGARWEAVAPGLLWKRLPWRIPLGGGQVAEVRALLSLDADPAIGATLQRAGVSAPDLLLIGRIGTRQYVRAADCKVSLDTADREQTAPARLQQMFARAAQDHPAVATALVAQVDALAEPERAAASAVITAALACDWDHLLLGEGLFVAPDNGFNRWFLSRLEDRRRTGSPLGRMPASGPRRSGADVSGPVDAAQHARLNLPSHLEQIGAREFLAGVPGWEEAQLVAQLDGLELEKADLAIAERCWRVGVGLRGAVVALKRRLFHNQLPIETEDIDPAAVLRQAQRRQRAADSAALVQAIARFVAARRALWAREAELLRPPVSFGAFSARMGESLRNRHRGPRSDDAAQRAGPSSRTLYRELTRGLVTRVAVLAAELESTGLADRPLLDALEARVEELTAAGESDAVRLTAGGGESAA